jgi:hypothetical protein
MDNRTRFFFHWLRRSTSAILISSLLVNLAGCTVEPRPDPKLTNPEFAAQTAQIRTVALVGDSTPTEIESITLGVTYGEGVARGAGGGALMGAGQALSGLTTCVGSPYCGAAVLLLLPIFVLAGAVVGGAAGGASGYSETELEQATTAARQMLQSDALKEELLRRAGDYARQNAELTFVRKPYLSPNANAAPPDYSQLRQEGVDAVLDVKLESLKLERSLSMTAHARLLSVSSGALLNEGQYEFLSEHRPLEGWMANGAQPLAQAVDRGLSALAEDIIDENFLLFYPTEPEVLATEKSEWERQNEPQLSFSLSEAVPHYVLRPIYPELDNNYCPWRIVFHNKDPHCQPTFRGLDFVEVNSSKPTLRWERFPRPDDYIEPNGGRRNKITEVSYEVRVFDTARSVIKQQRREILIPAQVVYSARSIKETYHTVDRNLEACGNYFWTVRARFQLNGRVRVTEWAGAFDLSPVESLKARPWNLRRGEIGGIRYHWYPVPYELYQPVLGTPEWHYFPFMTPCD